MESSLLVQFFSLSFQEILVKMIVIVPTSFTSALPDGVAMKTINNHRHGSLAVGAIAEYRQRTTKQIAHC